MDVDSLLAEAMRLSPEDRELLEARLALARAGEPELRADEPAHPAVEAALRERIRAYEARPEAGVPADEAVAQARGALRPLGEGRTEPAEVRVGASHDRTRPAGRRG